MLLIGERRHVSLFVVLNVRLFVYFDFLVCLFVGESICTFAYSSVKL